MRAEYWSYNNVKSDGTFENDPEHREGSVRPRPEMETSGLHWKQTRSAKSSGHWLSVSTGRLPDGTMHGITLFFDDENEMQRFEQTRRAEVA
jgi:hypothetical protein